MSGYKKLLPTGHRLFRMNLLSFFLMHQDLTAPKTIKTIAELEAFIIGRLRAIHKEYRHLGYVSGIIAAEGAERIPYNTVRLQTYLDALRTEESFPLFAATEVFTADVKRAISAHLLSLEDHVAFWRSIIGSGDVTDIYMTPRWEIAPGARDEHDYAKQLGIRVHYVPALPDYP